jgi:hypothetical protein
MDGNEARWGDKKRLNVFRMVEVAAAGFRIAERRRKRADASEALG